MTIKMSTADLAAKVKWEGGVFDTIVYGIAGDDIADPALAREWDYLVAMWYAVEAKMRPVQALLERAVPGTPEWEVAERVRRDFFLLDSVAALTPDRIESPTLSAAWRDLRDAYLGLRPPFAAMEQRLHAA